MEVTPNAGAGSTQRVTGKAMVLPRARLASDSVSFRDVETVNRALQQAADIRPEAVQRASAQVKDAQYPPLKTIQAISRLLAIELSQSDEQP
jgi:hypothetical protein